SEDMAWLMDQEIQKLIVDAEMRAEEILRNNKSTLVNLAETLIKEESLGREEIERIIKNLPKG
ncbi:MAG: cell division protein FtsH, partial [Candidatus Jettenia caeni]|nr:cell division protein FtsH [Candidatus Jettenia caeni]